MPQISLTALRPRPRFPLLIPIVAAPPPRVHLRALILSLAALTVPAVAALLLSEFLGQYGPLLWLSLLVPAFLLAYYRGWRGVATALAAGMATLSTTQVVASWMGIAIPDLLLGVVVVYLAIAMGVGWLAELLHRDKNEVEAMALTDTLTRLPKRRHALVFLENEFAAANHALYQAKREGRNRVRLFGSADGAPTGPGSQSGTS